MAVVEASPRTGRKGSTITVQILAGLILGIAVGYFWPSFGVAVKPLADAFLRMIKMIIAPLVFSTLVVGIAGSGDLKTMGRIGLKAIIYFEAATTVALFLGLALVNIFQPGGRYGDADWRRYGHCRRPGPESAKGLGHLPAHVSDLGDRLDGPRRHSAGRDLFDLLRRGACRGWRQGQAVLEVLESTAQVMFKVTGYVMMFAPIGVFAAIASTVGGKGLGILFTLGKVVALMYAGLAIFVLIVLGSVSYIIRVPFFTFVRAIREPFLIAFSTASSEAALPKAMDIMERFGVPKNIVAFVLPTGYSFNLDGSTLYLSLCSVFVAQLAGIRMTIGQQLVMMLTLMLTSKGVAGVPRASLVLLAATLSQFNLPLEGAAILLGIDQIMDMGRTGVNVMGNCIATAVVARWEGVLDDDKMRAFGR
jgi:proton glutamate symport protein